MKISKSKKTKQHLVGHFSQTFQLEVVNKRSNGTFYKISAYDLDGFHLLL